MSDEMEHPALKSFSSTWSAIKHIGAKALKWAAIGAVVGGAVAALLPAIVGAPIAGILGMIPGVGSTIAGWVGSGIMSSFVSGALGIGAVTGVIGALKGVAGTPEAINEDQDRAIAAYERGEAREVKMAAIRQRQAQGELALLQQAQGMGAAPGLTPGMGQGGRELT